MNYNQKNKPETELLIFVGNPTQYHSPIFRALNEKLNGAVEVLYGEEIGAKPFFSEELGATICWGEDVLRGFRYRFFHNLSPSSRKGFWSRNNPSLISYVFSHDAKYIMLHGYDTLSSWYVFFAAVFSGKKIIWRGEAIIRRNSTKWFARFAKLTVLPFYFSMCHRVLYSCSRNKEYLEQYVKNKSKLKFFPCAVDYDFFRKRGIRSENAKIKFKQENKIPLENVIISTCCRLTNRKRVDLIIKAISCLENKNITFLVLGNGPENKALSILADAHNVDLRIMGFINQENVAKFLSISDIFVLMSSYDASPKALNEALSFELPIIVSEGVGTSNDLVKQNKNGFIIELGGEEDLFKKLQRLTSSGVDLRSMGKNNFLITSEFSIENDAAAIGEIIDK